MLLCRGGTPRTSSSNLPFWTSTRKRSRCFLSFLCGHQPAPRRSAQTPWAEPHDGSQHRPAPRACRREQLGCSRQHADHRPCVACRQRRRLGHVSRSAAYHLRRGQPGSSGRHGRGGLRQLPRERHDPAFDPGASHERAGRHRMARRQSGGVELEGEQRPVGGRGLDCFVRLEPDAHRRRSRRSAALLAVREPLLPDGRTPRPGLDRQRRAAPGRHPVRGAARHLLRRLHRRQALPREQPGGPYGARQRLAQGDQRAGSGHHDRRHQRSAVCPLRPDDGRGHRRTP